MNKRRLLKLADFLSALPKAKFDFGVIAVQRGKPMLEALKLGKKECGTVACAIGWMPAVFPRLTKWNSYGDSLGLDVCLRAATVQKNFYAATRVFGIEYHEAEYLFNPGSQAVNGDDEDLSADATPKAVAHHIRAFVKRGGMPEASA